MLQRYVFVCYIFRNSAVHFPTEFLWYPMGFLPFHCCSNSKPPVLLHLVPDYSRKYGSVRRILCICPDPRYRITAASAERIFFERVPEQSVRYGADQQISGGYGWSGFWLHNKSPTRVRWKKKFLCGMHANAPAQGMQTPLVLFRHSKRTGRNPLPWLRRDKYKTDCKSVSIHPQKALRPESLNLYRKENRSPQRWRDWSR